LNVAGQNELEANASQNDIYWAGPTRTSKMPNWMLSSHSPRASQVAQMQCLQKGESFQLWSIRGTIHLESEDSLADPAGVSISGRTRAKSKQKMSATCQSSFRRSVLHERKAWQRVRESNPCYRRERAVKYLVCYKL